MKRVRPWAFGRGHRAPRRTLVRLAAPRVRYAMLWLAVAACLPASVGLGLVCLPGCVSLRCCGRAVAWPAGLHLLHCAALSLPLSPRLHRSPPCCSPLPRRCIRPYSSAPGPGQPDACHCCAHMAVLAIALPFMALRPPMHARPLGPPGPVAPARVLPWLATRQRD
jgi:hypothetical protein